ncbi:hypothetical protein GB882_15770, partial [Georgenia ruanii]|nr:hypothetical protein [Georgenia ruanii]
ATDARAGDLHAAPGRAVRQPRPDEGRVGPHVVRVPGLPGHRPRPDAEQPGRGDRRGRPHRRWGRPQPGDARHGAGPAGDRRRAHRPARLVLRL